MKTLKEKIIESLDEGMYVNPARFNNFIFDFLNGKTDHPYYKYYINEGLIWSYDPYFVKRSIMTAFRLKENDIRIFGIFDFDKYFDDEINHEDLNDKEQDAYIICRCNKLFKKQLEAGFNTCGWFLHNTKESKDNNKELYYFYPKYQNKVNKDILAHNKILYHYSLKKYENKIKKYGLTPRSKNDEYDYPDSIFLLKENTPDDDKIALIKQRYKTKEERENLIEIKIDVSKLQNDINFYIDPDKSNYSIFTYDNISPKCLIINDYKIIE